MGVFFQQMLYIEITDQACLILVTALHEPSRVVYITSK